MKEMKTHDSLLIIINESMIPNVIELLNDLNKNDISFSAKNCKKIKITNQGEIYLRKEVKKEEIKKWFKRNEVEKTKYTWELLDADKNSDYFYDSESETLKRVMLGMSIVLNNLKKEKKEILESIKKVKDMGCLTDICERKLITEKK